jgi:predicted transcriptional regulator
MTAAPREKRTFRLPRELARQLAGFARTRRQPQGVVVEAALAAFLAQAADERLETALNRRLDRISRELDRLEWRLELSTEALSLFIRFWLTSTPPAPDTARAAAQAVGKVRWEGFVEALSRRLELGPRLKDELQREASGRDAV